MPVTIKELRERAGLSKGGLARLANMDFRTEANAEDQQTIGSVQRFNISKLLGVLNERLGTTYTVDDVEGVAQ